MTNKILDYCSYLKNPRIYYIALPVALCLLFGSLAFSDQLWVDEIYTITEIHLDPVELWEVFATESHPPLYFYALMAFCGVFGDSILAMKIFSVLGCLATILLGAFPVRRAFGDKTALWFMFLCLTMPFMMRYSVEIRMYSWAIFFVTAALIYAILAVKTNKILDWGLYFVFGLLGAWTHLYALMAVAALHAILGLYLLIINKKYFLSWFITSILYVLTYLPWIPQLLAQVSGVEDGYWVFILPPLTIRDIITIPSSLFYIGDSFRYLQYILLGVLVVFGCMMLYRIISTRAKEEREKFALLCIFVPLTVYGISIIFSFILQPLIVARYLMVMAGFGLLFLSLYLSTLHSKKIIIAFCILMLVTTGANYGILYNQEYPTDGDSLVIVSEKIIQDFPSDTIFIHPNVNSFGMMSYYLPYVDNGYIVQDNEVEYRSSSYLGKLSGSIVTVTNIISAINSGNNICVVTLHYSELPEPIIQEHFQVTLEKEYLSNSPNYPIWKIWSINPLEN